MQGAARSRPFLWWLLLVQLCAVLPLVGFALILTHQLAAGSEQAQIARLEQRVAVTANAVAREFDRARAQLALLASQDAALDDDAVALGRQAMRLVQPDGGVAGVSAVDDAGRTVFASGITSEQLADGIVKPDDSPVFHGGGSTVSALLQAADGTLLVDLAHPWRVGDSVRYALRMSLRQSTLGNVLREQHWEPTWTAALIDQRLHVAARSRDEARFVASPASPSLQDFIRTRGAGTGFSRTLDGTEAVASVAAVRGTPWWVVAGLPRSTLLEDARRPVQTLIAVSLTFVVLGIFLSYALARRLHREFIGAVTGRTHAPSHVTEFRALEIQRLMLDNELVGMVRLRERVAVWHNRALETIFGYAPGELDGHSPRLMHPSDAAFEAFGRKAYSVLAGGRPFRDQIEMVRKDGRRIWVDVSGIELAVSETLWMIVDISGMKAELSRVESLATHDPLTGLPNRAALTSRLVEALATAARTGMPLAVCFLDLNGFKPINDRHGHAVGDEVLVAVARRLENALKPTDLVARLGGDEFVVLLAQLPNPGAAAPVVQRLREVVGAPIALADGDTVRIDVAIGVAVHPDDGASDPEQLVELADRRMYADKPRR